MTLLELIKQLADIYIDQGDIKVSVGDEKPLAEVEHVAPIFNGDPHYVVLW